MASDRVYLRKEPIAVAVGWDNPLQTYFVNAYIPGWETEEGCEDDITILWIGTPRTKLLPEISDLEEALENDLPAAIRAYCANQPALKKYGEDLKASDFELSPQLRQKLENDKATSGPPTELQQWAANMFRNLGIGENSSGE